MDKEQRLKELFKQVYEGIGKCTEDCNGCKLEMMQALNVIENAVIPKEKLNVQ